MKDCLFCQIVNKEKEAYVIFENEDIIVFLSLENHPLIVPKKHYKDIYELDESIGSPLMQGLVETSKLVKKALKCEGVYITQANEPAAGQDVFHIHFHVYPRWEGQEMNQLHKVDNTEREMMLNKLKQTL